MGSAMGELPRLSAKGTRMVDPAGNPVTLRGCNLGNWFLLENWMNEWHLKDQVEIDRTLVERFGQGKHDEIMEKYRAGWISERDFDVIKTFGFNVVRLPVNYVLIADEKPPYAMREAGLKWIDRALQMAEAHGIYVILDLHGAPGRQSTDQPSGEVNANHLFFDPAAQQGMLDIWTALARRYKDRSVIAAYDLVNEPFGNFDGTYDVHLRKLMPRVYDAVRATGDTHVVLFPATIKHGFFFYEGLKDLKQVALTDHFYPGLFGSPTALSSHYEKFQSGWPKIQDFLDQNQVPMLAGEFNVVLDSTGGVEMMRAYYDEFARRGWMATMWSYKLMKPAAGAHASTWYMATNAEPLAKIDLKTSSLEEIEAWADSLATVKLAVREDLREALTRKEGSKIPILAVKEKGEAGPNVLAGDAADLSRWATLGTVKHSEGGVAFDLGSADEAGVWVDVPTTAKGSYTFAVDAKKTGTAEPREVELRLETELDGRRLTLAQLKVKPATLKDGEVSHLTLAGPTLGEKTRLLIRVKGGKGEGELAFSAPSLGEAK